MARCSFCNEDNLDWQQVNNKWQLFGGMNRDRDTGRHICQKAQPKMGRREKRLEKDLESRRMKIIGIRFNNSNLKDGLLDAILKGNIKYDVTD